MTKTKKNYKSKGGKVIASGGYGCVFKPALKCEGSKKRETNKITKLMTDKHATQEYEEIIRIKEKLDKIPNYRNYFLLYDATLCRPSKLNKSDLTAFGDKCTALPKDDITKENINTKLNEIMALNIPNGGLPVDDYIYSEVSFKKIYDVHTELVELLKNGIVPMNKNGIYHSDIKDSNILVDDSGGSIKTRLIDWGLTVEYEPNKKTTFPRNWRNRPLQFNVPFSVVIFTDSFYEKYSKYIKDGGEVNEISLRPFVVEYLTFWMKERGPGHYKFINELMFMLYSDIFTDISVKKKPLLIETEITMPIITNYIVDVLVHYTKFKEDGSLNLREYLNEVYIKIIDIYGFINAYFPLLELLFNNYNSLKENELSIFKQLVFIYNTYLYNPRHEPINMNDLFDDFKKLGIFIQKAENDNKPKIQHSNSGRGLTKKINKKTSIFKRKKLIKKFKKPLFLLLK